jgi:hypothetical protein
VAANGSQADGNGVTMPRLTEQEQQEIIRYIEADKPLPEKFRFLLFEDKREVELVWNGKTNEVCNIVLPFQVIEQVDEPRAEKPEDTALQAGLGCWYSASRLLYERAHDGLNGFFTYRRPPL